MTRLTLAFCVIALAAGCHSTDEGDAPLDLTRSAVGDAVAREVDDMGLGIVTADVARIGYDIETPVAAVTPRDVDADTCGQVQLALDRACTGVIGSGARASCWGQTALFFANTTPRCAARVWVGDGDGDRMYGLYAFDFQGEPYDGPAPECGNGELEPGEQCDDGNTDPWDGCDAACYLEDFNGCEAVIEHHYRVAELAVVDKALWDGGRSHVMTHPGALALRAVDELSCNAALAVGADVCNELMSTMPFVGWCQPMVEHFADAEGPACAVRFEVGFQQIDPDAGVYTLALPGILSFTIR